MQAIPSVHGRSPCAQAVLSVSGGDVFGASGMILEGIYWC